MNWDCQEVANHLIDIIEENMPASQKKAILDHTAVCPRCDRLLKDFSRVWQDISTAEKRTPSEGFWPGLLAKIEARERPRPFREKMIAGLRISFRAAAVSLILAFGIYFGYYLGNTPSMETAQSDVPSFEQYIRDFQDFPEGSVSDFYTQYEVQNQQEVP
jgi:hypothetical protein